MDLYSKIVLFFQHGGEFMYPIALVMAIGVAISLERYFYLARQTSANRRDYEKILPLLRAQRMREIQDLASKSKSGGWCDCHPRHRALEPYRDAARTSSTPWKNNCSKCCRTSSAVAPYLQRLPTCNACSDCSARSSV